MIIKKTNGPKGITRKEFAQREGCSYSNVTVGLRLGRLTAYDDGSLDPAQIDNGWRSRKGRPTTRPPISKTNDPPQLETPIDESGSSTPPLKEREIKALSKSDAERYKLIYGILAQKREFDQAMKEVARLDQMLKVQADAYARVRNRLIQISADLAPNMVMIETAGEAQEIIHRGVCKALAAVSEEAWQRYNAQKAKIESREDD
jgi:hypothetical protein